MGDNQEGQILARLQKHPDLLARFKAGDLSVLKELVEVGTGSTVGTREIQRDALVVDDLGPYRGCWVAVRDGHVVATALDPIALRETEDVQADDWIILVPSAPEGALRL